MRLLDLTYEGAKVYYDAKGYACVWRSKTNKMVHVLEWEKHNGPKPLGYEIHHKDRDKGNWDVSNLELLTNSDHQRVHAGWIREGGVWTKKPCTACHRALPLEEFYPRTGYTPSAKCKECHVLATNDWARRNPEKRKKIALDYYYRNKGK